MRVTKKNTKPVMVSRFELLARFLNFNFRSDNLTELKGLFTSSLVAHRFPARQKAEQLQRRLKEDLLPIIAPTARPEPVEAYKLVNRLVEKINKMNLKLEWAVVPAEYDFIGGGPRGKDLDLLELEPEEAREKKRQYLAPMQKPLEMLGARWIVSERASLIESKNLMDYFYWTIINAMEHGELSKLKVCGECHNFFVQSDARQEFCSDKCRTNFNNKRRLAEGYFTAKRRENQRRELAKARRLLKDGKSPEEVAKHTRLSLRLLKREGLLQ